MILELLPGARRDLAAIRQSDPDAFDVVVVFLQEAGGDETVISKFTTIGDSVIGSLRINVKPWISARRTIGNISRIRILDSAATSYRIVFGYDWRARRIGVLAVVHKDRFDYAVTGTLARRIEDDWRIATDGLST